MLRVSGIIFLTEVQHKIMKQNMNIWVDTTTLKLNPFYFIQAFYHTDMLFNYVMDIEARESAKKFACKL